MISVTPGLSFRSSGTAFMLASWMSFARVFEP